MKQTDHITNPKFLEKVDKFLKNITDKDVVTLIHDTDPDGICSGTIMAKCVERLRGRTIDYRIPLDKANYGLTENMLKEIKRNKSTIVITCDFSAEGNLPALKEIEKQAKVLVVDHHKLYNDYQTERVILYKPQFFTSIEPSTYCTAKLAYDAAARVCDVNDLDWIATAGCIADIATAPWMIWITEVFKKYNVPMKENFFDTVIGQCAATISSTEVYDVKLVPQCFDAFYSAKKPEDILNGPFGKYKKIIDLELEEHKKLFEEKGEKKEDMIIYEMKSPYRIHSILSTILGLKYPHKTIVIINHISNKIAVSSRRGDKKKAVNELLEQCIKGFPNANAGGHVPAAGAGFEEKDLSEFKKRLWNSLE
jgi:single-stranded DNA-specific DHH superfamily exonuclease